MWCPGPSRHSRTILSTSLLIFLMAPGLPATEKQSLGPNGPVPAFNANFCPGKVEPPIGIAIEGYARAIRPRARLSLFGSVSPRTDIPMLVLRFETEGPVSLLGPEVIEIGPVSEGQAIPFSIPVRYQGVGEAAVHVWADAFAEDGSHLYSKRQTLYALLRAERSYVGTASFQQLELEAIREDRLMGRLSPEQAAAAEKALAHVPALRDDRPMVFLPLTAAEEQLNGLVAPDRKEVALKPQGVSATAANITVQGNVQWTDENGNTHPVFGATASIRDDDGIFGTEFITAVVTDVNGNYSAVVDDNDGPLQGDRDIFVVIRAANSFVNTTTSGGSTYEMQSPVHNETPGGSTITENFTAGNTGTGPAFSVFQAGTRIASYATLVHGSAFPQVDIRWPDTGSFYDGTRIHLVQGDRWDWDVAQHEYGHYAADRINIENNPGGPHGIGDCISDVAPMGGSASKDRGVRLAWGEGWPTYFGTSGQQVLNMAVLNVPRVGDVSYQDLEDANLVYSLEAQSSIGKGEDNEVAVQRLLWDLFDTNSDGRDAISRSHTSIWTALDAADPTTLSAGWTALRAGQSNATQILMGEIATDQQIGPSLISPAETSLVTPSNLNFSWNRLVGCSNTYAGNSFDLVFYNPSTFAEILKISGLGTPSATLTVAQLATLIGASANHQVLWAVEGRNTSSPATGPYLGESFLIRVNRPPVANAGPDQLNVECTSPTTTPVTLNGTGSSDPDGDTLTFTWSAPGVTFNNPNSPTPTGQFPKGTKTVTLTVSDGLQQSTDTVVITVKDTTPPVITCPANITVECTQAGGTPKTNPLIAAFLAGASATDVCDTTPTITNNAPNFFPLGPTNVTFTATDDDGNSSTCVRTVTVVDTTPPVITVSVSPTELWPPNHKLEEITATVTVSDICDPNPTFVLTSITSNEPDDGLGDGDTPNDIQEAAFGTPDVQFKLRAERSGTGSGRIYTIRYTASDMSGNTSQATATVQVPHNR